MDLQKIMAEIKAKNFKPVYLLHGEEPFFIDKIAQAIEADALEEHERDFNQSIIYGKDVDPIALLAELRNYPMMAERRLVIVREAQELADKNHEILESYFKEINPETVFVFCYKYKKLDSRKTFYKGFQKHGHVFLSDKIRDYKLVDWIMDYLQKSRYKISLKAATLLAENIGNDLSRIVNELDKLMIVVKEGTEINEVHIEENIGISKEYNPLELVTAVQKGDFPKAMKIVNYFEHNPKSGPFVVINIQLFNMFLKLMRLHFLENKSNDSIVSALKINPFFVKDYINSAKLYSAKRIARNVSVLHEYDLKSKGVGSTGEVSDGELMKEMIYKLMH